MSYIVLQSINHPIPMRRQLYLHALIQSLSPAEKRYFALSTQKSGKKNPGLYFQLFSALSQQAVYDEAALKKEFAGTSFARQLAFPKSHLYGQVLRALQAFHYEKGNAARFGSYLGKIELLAGRGFPDQALSQVEKRLKTALDLSLAMPVLQLLRWKRRLVLRLQRKDYSAVIAAITAEEIAWEARLLQEQAAVRLHDALYMALQEARRKTMARDATALQEKAAALADLAAQDGLTFEAQLALCRARAHLAHLSDDFQAVHAAYADEVQVWQAHPRQLKEDSLRFVRTFGAWLNSKTLIGDAHNLLAEIQRLRAQEGMGKQEQALVFRITYSLELFHYLNREQFDQGMGIVPALAAGLEKYSAFLSPGFKLGFYHNLAVLLWLGGQPGQALSWVQAILQFEPGEIRRDIRRFAPLAEKVLWYECGHVSQLESWFRAYQYRRRKEGETSPLEAMLFTLIRGLLMETEGDSHAILFRQFRKNLSAYAQQPAVSKLGLEELRHWASEK